MTSKLIETMEPATLARMIHETPDDQLDQYSNEELAFASAWVKRFTLLELELYLKRKHINSAISRFVITCARAHWGAAETDELMIKLALYPRWMQKDV